MNLQNLLDDINRGNPHNSDIIKEYVVELADSIEEADPESPLHDNLLELHDAAVRWYDATEQAEQAADALADITLHYLRTGLYS